MGGTAERESRLDLGSRDGDQVGSTVGEVEEAEKAVAGGECETTGDTDVEKPTGATDRDKATGASVGAAVEVTDRAINGARNGARNGEMTAGDKTA